MQGMLVEDVEYVGVFGIGVDVRVSVAGVEPVDVVELDGFFARGSGADSGADSGSDSGLLGVGDAVSGLLARHTLLAVDGHDDDDDYDAVPEH